MHKDNWLRRKQLKKLWIDFSLIQRDIRENFLKSLMSESKKQTISDRLTLLLGDLDQELHYDDIELWSNTILLDLSLIHDRTIDLLNSHVINIDVKSFFCSIKKT